MTRVPIHSRQDYSALLIRIKLHVAYETLLHRFHDAEDPVLLFAKEHMTQSFFYNIDENYVNFDTAFSQIDICFLDAQMQPVCYTITHEGILFVCE